MTLTLQQIFTLLVVFQIKHFVGDYLLQTGWMVYGKAKTGTQWIVPLLAHCVVHGVLTLGLILIWNPDLWYLCFVDIALHFAMDRIKASPNLLGRWPLGTARFFQIFGFDQMVHHFTDYWIAYVILGSLTV